MVTTTQHWNHGEWTDKQWCISIGLKINPIWKITWQLVGTHSTTKFSLGTVIFQIFEFVQTSWRILLYDTLTIQLTKWPFTVTTRLHQIEHCVFRNEIKFNLSTFLLKYSGNSTQNFLSYFSISVWMFLWIDFRHYIIEFVDGRLIKGFWKVLFLLRMQFHQSLWYFHSGNIYTIYYEAYHMLYIILYELYDMKP